MKRFSEQGELLKKSRTRARHRALIRIFAWFAGAFALLGAGAYALVVSEALAVREVRVEGARLVSGETVTRALADAAGARTLRGWIGADLMPFWFFLKPPQAFLAAHPVFREVTVRPRLFAREVVIRVSERALFGVWCLEKRNCYAFDEEGVAFGKAPDVFGALIVKVEDARTMPLSLGAYVLADAGDRAVFRDVLAALARARITLRAVTVGDAALREWEVSLAGGPLLKFSFAFAPERLDEALAALSRRPDFRALALLDFRVKDRLYYK